MRIGLISALRHSNDGPLRADLALAGRSVLAWQAALLQSFGAERVLCLTDGSGSAALVALQHSVEAGGAAFHALRSFAALAAVVRAEDDLIILNDGLVPDPETVRGMLGGAGSLRRVIAAIPADHPLAAAHPADFERIDAARHWAGVLVMRGAPVQQLADFPADADAVSLLLRLALQAGTPCCDLAASDLVPERWLLADSTTAVMQHQRALIAGAAASADWRAPMMALAARTVRAMAPRGLQQGGLIAGAAALMLLLGGVLAAAFSLPATGLVLAGLGAFAARIGLDFSVLAARLQRREIATRSCTALALVVDALAGVTLWFGLAPWPQWQPLAALGPVVIGLARLAALRGSGALAVLASDRAALLLALAPAAALGLLPEAAACLALGLLTALLLRARTT